MQDLESPLGVGGMGLHEWILATRTFGRLHGDGDGATGVDDDFAALGFSNIGAWILGRNMFGPSRGSWPDDKWKGWWGDNPPYHTPVFVLTHHARAPITMEGGTTFHFVTEDIHAALQRATFAAAKLKYAALWWGGPLVRSRRPRRPALNPHSKPFGRGHPKQPEFCKSVPNLHDALL
jgi:dihydrofolate reductase